MRYRIDTRLRPGEVFALARKYFGPEGPVGLDLTTLNPNQIGFAGGGGFIMISAHRGLSQTRLDFEVYQLDQEVQAFFDQLPGPEGRIRAAIRRLLRRKR